MGKHTNSGLGGFMSGASIRFSKMKGNGGVDAWRDQLASAYSGKRDSGRPRTTGTQLPKVNTIHSATIVSVKEYGAFVQLGNGDTFRDGMLHISAMGKDIQRVQDFFSEGMKVWVKVVEVTEATGKYGVDIRYVSQKDGSDLDPHNCKSYKLPDNHLPGANRPVEPPAQEPLASSSSCALAPPRSNVQDDAGDIDAKSKRKKKKKKGSSSDESEDSDLVSAADLAAAKEKADRKLRKAAKKLEKLKRKAEKARLKNDKKSKQKAAKASARSASRGREEDDDPMPVSKKKRKRNRSASASSSESGS